MDRARLPIGDRRGSGASHGSSIRRELVAARTRRISVARAITRHAGYRIAGGATDMFLQRVAAPQIPPALDETLAPVRHVMEVLDDELARVDTHSRP